MANISVSVDTFLDTASGTRAAGDAVTFTAAANFTVRTDTRWYNGAPASMTGTLGSVTLSRGAGFYVDGSKVRWLAFSSGSGTVPAINTSITQSGTTGTLLGVWADLTSAPTAVGAAMPATGFIKFREVTGSYSAGALSGISASATGPDVTGWIEVVFDTGAVITSAPNGSGIAFFGDWFSLGTTTGAAGQILQMPTNGGGSGTILHGVQIETAVGSNTYEWYPSLLTSDKFTSAFMSTDARSKFVQSMGNGQVRIGSDGTTSMGYVPAAGLKIRMPNIIVRPVATASRATNQVPGGVTRNTFTVGPGTNLSFEKVHADFTLSAANAPATIHLTNSIFENTFAVTGCTSVIIDGTCFSQYIVTSGSRFTLTGCSNIQGSDVKAVNKTTYILGVLRLDICDTFSYDGLELISLGAQSSSNTVLTLPNCSNGVFNSAKLKGGTVNISTRGSNLQFYNTDYCDNTFGTTSSTSSSNLFSVDASDNIVVDGLTFGENGVVANTHLYGTILSTGTNGCKNIKIRNIGTASAPLDCGSNASFYPSAILNSSASTDNIKIQKVYLSGLRSTSFSLFAAASVGFSNRLFESIYIGTSGVSGTTESSSNNDKLRGLYITNNETNISAVIKGTHWKDYFGPSITTTVGQIVWAGTTPNVETSANNFISSISTYAGYTGTGLALGEIGDTAYSEMDFYIKGHTGFQNVAPTITGVTPGNYSIEYDIDIGTGFSGTWKALTAANLSAETVNPAGTKLKLLIKMIATTNVTTSELRFIKIATTTSVAARAANQYPLDTAKLEFTNLVVSSEVRVYQGTDPATAVEIGGIESSGQAFSFSHSYGGQSGVIAIFAMGYQPIYLPYSFHSSDDSILIQQVIDRNYVNP